MEQAVVSYVSLKKQILGPQRHRPLHALLWHFSDSLVTLHGLRSRAQWRQAAGRRLWRVPDRRDGD